MYARDNIRLACRWHVLISRNAKYRYIFLLVFIILFSITVDIFVHRTHSYQKPNFVGTNRQIEQINYLARCAVVLNPSYCENLSHPGEFIRRTGVDVARGS